MHDHSPTSTTGPCVHAGESAALLAAIVESATDAIVSSTLDGIVTTWNAGAERMFGYSAAQAIGRNIEITIPADRVAEAAEASRRAAAGEAQGPTDTIRQTRDGRMIDVSILISAVRNSDGRVIGLSTIARDSAAQRGTRQALGDTEARHRAVIETAVDGIITIDERGIIESLNPAAERLFGATASELVGQNINVLMPSPYREHHDQYLRNYLGTGERRIIGIGREVVGLRRDGSTFPMDLAVSELSLGGKRMFTGLVRDITDRKRAEARQRLMADELDHRVKNNLAAVLSLATQTLTTAQTLAQFQTAFTGRLRAMANTHTALARSRWEGVKLEELAEFAVAPFRDESGQRVRVHGPSIQLPARAATPITLTLHELVTNAAKYGALSTPEGYVELAWTRVGETVTISWQEHNGPTVVRPARTGSGTEIIEGLIRYELRGQLDLRYEPAGVVCTIIVSPEAGSPQSQASRE